MTEPISKTKDEYFDELIALINQLGGTTAERDDEFLREFVDESWDLYAPNANRDTTV